MKDIAKACGVSVATVSKALNGQKDIGEETRKKISKTAAEMGYMTNAAARALKTNRTYNIGVLFVDEKNSGLTHPHFSKVLDSLKVEAEKNGYDITFINHHVGSRSMTYLQHALYRGMDGVIIACVDFAEPEVQELIDGDVPVVTIDHLFNNRTAVLSDNVSGMDSLVRYVYDKGHRKLAFIYGESHSSVTDFRVKSFCRTCQELDIEVEEEYLLAGRYTDPDRCRKCTEELLSMEERPTCIFFPDDFSAIGGINAITDAGLRIPEDISVVGYDGINISQVISPKLTTYQQDTERLGALAARRLIQAIEHPRTTLPEQVMVSGQLLEGESVLDLNY